jgi:MYXO-CTERM domain-containing protein
VCALPSRVRAHEPPHGIRLAWTSDDADAMPVVVANRGIVFAEGGGANAYVLRCNEGYNVLTSARPQVLVDDQGALVIASTAKITRTSDRACTFMDSTGLPTSEEQASLDLSLGGFAQDPSKPQRVLVSTQVYKSPAQVYVSEDYGRTWQTLSTNRMYSVYRELLIAADGQHVIASGQHYEPAPVNKLSSMYAYSSDGGKTWTDVDVESERTPLGFLPSDPNVVFMREKIPNLNLSPKDRLLRSVDGGKTFEPVGGEWSPISTFAATPDGADVWVGTPRGGLFRSTDQGKTFSRVLEEMITGADCLYYRQDVLWSCINVAPNTNGIWSSTNRGASFEKRLEFEEVKAQVPCADVEICEMPWRDWEYELLNGWENDAGLVGNPPEDAGSVEDAGTVPELDAGVAEPDAGAPVKKSSGGCNVSGDPTAAGLSWLALAGLGLLRRRRDEPRRRDAARTGRA